MKIILDANFLVYCAKQKIDYVEEINNIVGKAKLVIPSSVIEELEKLKKEARKAKDKEAADLALGLIKSKKIKILKTREKADKAIKKAAGKNVVIATMDRQLKRHLKGKTRILSIRQRKYLEIL